MLVVALRPNFIVQRHAARPIPQYRSMSICTGFLTGSLIMEHMDRRKEERTDGQSPGAQDLNELQTPQREEFTVWVDDNYHFMDEGERYKLGDFATEAQALAAAKAIVDEFLLEHYIPGMSAEQLLAGYKQYGEDPWFVSTEQPFSAWRYAEERCRKICGREPESS